jgi:hypothetical protein
MSGFDIVRRAELPVDGLQALRSWVEQALTLLDTAGVVLPRHRREAGAPDARMVVVRGVDDRGLRFLTSTTSAKAQQLAAAPRACVVFWWAPLMRQVGSATSYPPVLPSTPSSRPGSGPGHPPRACSCSPCPHSPRAQPPSPRSDGSDRPAGSSSAVVSSPSSPPHLGACSAASG